MAQNYSLTINYHTSRVILRFREMSFGIFVDKVHEKTKIDTVLGCLLNLELPWSQKSHLLQWFKGIQLRLATRFYVN